MDSNFISDELLQTHRKFLKTQQIIDPHFHVKHFLLDNIKIFQKQKKKKI